MPLFKCDKCHCVENTATGFYWGRDNHEEWFGEEYENGKAICSECGPSHFKSGNPTKFEGKWHNRFKKEHACGLFVIGDSPLVFSIGEVSRDKELKSRITGRVEADGSIMQMTQNSLSILIDLFKAQNVGFESADSDIICPAPKNIGQKIGHTSVRDSKPVLVIGETVDTGVLLNRLKEKVNKPKVMVGTAGHIDYSKIKEPELEVEGFIPASKQPMSRSVNGRRNLPCQCGSGKKAKKCCGSRMVK